jgi:dienelactone hydrolase
MLLRYVHHLAIRFARRRPGPARSKRPASRFRPRLEALEERLPPGDMVLGALLGDSWSGLSLPVVAADVLPAGTPSLGDLSATFQTRHSGRRSEVDDLPSGFGFSVAALHARGAGSEFVGANGWTPSQVLAEKTADEQSVRAALTPPAVNDPFASALAADPVQRLGTFDAAAAVNRAGHLDSPGSTEGLSAGSGSAAVSAGAAGQAAARGFVMGQPLIAAAGASAIVNAGPPAALLEAVANRQGLTAADAGGFAAPNSHRRVHAGFDLTAPTGGPFPSNHFTVTDPSQNTGRRANLPLPDATTNPSDYQDTQVLNTLDGFSLQPRLSIPFDGPIDVNSVSSNTVFLVSLGDTLDHHDHGGQAVGINQVVWDVASNSLHVQSDQLLDQHTRYAMIVTNGVQDQGGHPVQATEEFRHFRQTVHGAYQHDLLDAVHAARRLGVRERDIVTASVFTTESATAVLEKIRDQVHAAIPEPADFNLGQGGERTVFNLNDVTGITWNKQTGDEPPTFTPTSLPVSLLRIVPGAVGQIAFGKYVSPDYEVHPGEYVPPVGTRTGTPVVQGTNEIYFNLFLPSGLEPANGWPVAIAGHGSGGSKNDVVAVAAKLAEHGIATIAINAVGHGFGPLSTLAISQQGSAPVTFSAGGRGIDQNADHVIDAGEGVEAAAPRRLIHDRDGLRQTVVDLMQLVRVIEVGVDVNGDGTSALDPAHIYYVGQSLGGDYGTQFIAVEPDVGSAVLNVPVADEAVRGVFSPTFRPSRGAWLAERTPSLINSPGVTAIGGVKVAGPFFNDNLPLRTGVSYGVVLEDGTRHDVPSPVVNDVPGAMAIQEVFANAEWAMFPGDALAYVPHVRKDPLVGVPPKSIIVQFDTGDQNVPNPISSAMLRAGELADRATYYRHDLAFAENPTLPKNGHSFLGGIGNPAWRDIALGTQEQIAVFFASDGTEVVHPEPARFFEVPIQGPLPEDLNYIL